MRILHTADWHLGRVLHQVSLLEDQAELLEQVFLLCPCIGLAQLLFFGVMY